MPRNKGLIFCLFIFFKIMLDFIFTRYIGAQYIYYGYILETSTLKTTLMWVAFLIYIPIGIKWLYTDLFKEKTLFFVSLMYYVPGLSLYQFVKVESNMFWSWMLFWWVLFVCAFFPSLKILNRFVILQGKYIVYALFFIVILIVLFYSWRYTGFRLRITFTDEYSLRSEERNIVMPTLIGYLYAGAPVILSFGMIACLLRNKYVLAFAFVIIQVFYFSIGGHKSVLILMLVSIGIAVVGKYIKENYRNILLIVAMVLELLFEIVIAFFFNTTVVTANISRRVYFVPQILNLFYYDYFSKNGFDYYAHGMGRILGINSNYSVPPARIISEEFFGTSGNANNGLYSEAYSNLGIIGCIILPILILTIIWVLGYFLENCDYTVSTLMGFICAYIWGSGNITTGQLTNGIMLCIFCVYMLYARWGLKNERKYN